jgi:omega-6 fatty acid desaturase (delta-12 desaturase)
MNDMTSPSPELTKNPSLSPRVQLGPQLAKAGYRLGGIFAPGFAGRIAADAFGRSRPKGSQTLFRMPLGAQSYDIIGNDDVRQAYLWKNAGPTALLVHGWGSESSSMSGFVKPLLSLGFKVAAFDAPAHGASVGSKTTMTRFVKAVESAIQSLGDVQIIIAHSLGSIASIAAVANTRLSDSMKCMVLLAAPISLTSVLERWATNEHQQLPSAVIRKIYDRLHVQNGVPVSHWDISKLGAGLDVPMLVLHDVHDPIVPFSEAEKLVRSLRNARLERTSGLGHARILSATPVKAQVTHFISEFNLN